MYLVDMTTALGRAVLAWEWALEWGDYSVGVRVPCHCDFCLQILSSPRVSPASLQGV